MAPLRIWETTHLALLDLMLPGADGIELMESVPGLAGVPVIFLSAYGPPQRLSSFMQELDGHDIDLHLHAVGDRATRNILDAVEQAQDALGRAMKIEVTICRRSAIMGHFQGEKNVREVGC